MNEAEILEMILNNIQENPSEDTKILWVKDNAQLNIGYFMVEDVDGQVGVYLITVQKGKVELA